MPEDPILVTFQSFKKALPKLDTMAIAMLVLAKSIGSLSGQLANFIDGISTKDILLDPEVKAN